MVTNTFTEFLPDNTVERVAYTLRLQPQSQTLVPKLKLNSPALTVLVAIDRLRIPFLLLGSSDQPELGTFAVVSAWSIASVRCLDTRRVPCNLQYDLGFFSCFSELYRSFLDSAR